MVQNFADIGVKLNVQLCNIVMLNAVEAGDLKTAFSIYHSLVENNLRADMYTHAILLKGCKAVSEDSETLNATIRNAIADTESLKSPVVCTEILDCLYLHHFETNPSTAFSTVSQAYLQLFDAKPLIQMHILPENCQDSVERPRPTLPALGIMFTAYLRQHSAQNQRRDVYLQRSLYRRYRDHVERGIKPFIKLCERDYISNAFLMAFTKNAASLPQAAEVIRDMQVPLPANMAKPDNLVNKTVPCQPTRQSWSIFMHGFARHGKMGLAEQVLTYMRERDMRPNQVTWNTLINGYASQRDTEGVIDTLRRMRIEGYKGNSKTSTSLSKVRLDDDDLKIETARKSSLEPVIDDQFWDPEDASAEDDDDAPFDEPLAVEAGARGTREAEDAARASPS